MCAPLTTWFATKFHFDQAKQVACGAGGRITETRLLSINLQYSSSAGRSLALLICCHRPLVIYCVYLSLPIHALIQSSERSWLIESIMICPGSSLQGMLWTGATIIESWDHCSARLAGCGLWFVAKRHWLTHICDLAPRSASSAVLSGPPIDAQ